MGIVKSDELEIGRILQFKSEIKKLKSDDQVLSEFSDFPVPRHRELFRCRTVYIAGRLRGVDTAGRRQRL
jgi:hypothetical protein